VPKGRAFKYSKLKVGGRFFNSLGNSISEPETIPATERDGQVAILEPATNIQVVQNSIPEVNPTRFGEATQVGQPYFEVGKFHKKWLCLMLAGKHPGLQP